MRQFSKAEAQGYQRLQGAFRVWIVPVPHSRGHPLNRQANVILLNDEIAVMVEIPRGSRNKYEYDEATGRFRLDRVLYASVHYPAEYGFVLGTRAPDGDPLDAVVLTYEPTFPGCVVPARPVGVLDMRDEEGLDLKILAVPTGDPRFECVHDLCDVQRHWLVEIENFFATYKTLEGTVTEVTGWRDAAAAQEVIAACREGSGR